MRGLWTTLSDDLLDQTRQRLPEFDVVLAVQRGQCRRQNRRSRHHIGECSGRGLARRQRLTGVDRIKLAERNRLAGSRGCTFAVGTAIRHGNSRDPAAATTRRLHGIAVGDMPAQDARQRQLAAMLKMRGLHDIGEPRLLVVNAEAFGGGRDIGSFVAQRLHQPQHTVLARRAAEQHRTNLPFAQFVREIVKHLVARRRNILEQLFEQPVVMIGEFLQHGEPGFLLAVEIARFEVDDFRGHVLAIDKGALQREIDETRDEIALPDRNLPQHQRRARGRLQRRQRFADALVRLVDLVEEQETRNPEVFEFAHDDLQLRQLALVGLAHDDRGIDRRQRGTHVVREFNGARTIDEGVAVAHEAGGRGCQPDTHAVVTRLRRLISDGVACFNGACFGNGPGPGQDRFK